MRHAGAGAAGAGMVVEKWLLYFTSRRGSRILSPNRRPGRGEAAGAIVVVRGKVREEKIISGSGKPRTAATRGPQPVWAEWPDEKLMELRFCDLDLTLKGTVLEVYMRRIQARLRRRNILCRPHVWLSEEWFTPDGVPGFGVPFYLAHPRLTRLEKNQMIEVEGGTREWCMRILRHETGHAIDNAYRLRLRRKRREIFGLSSEAYPEYYSPRPYSKRFVLHLDSWYAQSHPDEDFAETFAVWFHGNGSWRRRYAGWPALKKLEYLDELMQDIAGKKPPVTTRRLVEPIHRIKRTLGEHYEEKRERYGEDYPDFYDRDLRRLFSDAPEHATMPAAPAFLRRARREVRRNVARWTGCYQYTIDQLFTDLIDRAQQLKLRLPRSEEETKNDFTVMLTVQTMNYLHSGRHRIAL